MNYVYPNNSSGGGGLQETVIAQVDGIDFASSGNTTLYAVPVGTSVITTKAIIFIDSAAGLGGTMESSLGFNVTADNIVPLTTLTGFSDTPQQIYIMYAQGVTYVSQGGNTIRFRVNTPFTGTAAGSVVLFGIEVNE